jgi:hypothetical protein
MPFNYSVAINALNSSDAPMENTHFYRYLKLGGYTDNSVTAKTNYLGSLGFIVGTDKVSRLCLNKLGYILDHYYLNEVRSK